MRRFKPRTAAEIAADINKKVSCLNLGPVAASTILSPDMLACASKRIDSYYLPDPYVFLKNRLPAFRSEYAPLDDNFAHKVCYQCDLHSLPIPPNCVCYYYTKYIKCELRCSSVLCGFLEVLKKGDFVSPILLEQDVEIRPVEIPCLSEIDDCVLGDESLQTNDNVLQINDNIVYGNEFLQIENETNFVGDSIESENADISFPNIPEYLYVHLSNTDFTVLESCLVDYLSFKPMILDCDDDGSYVVNHTIIQTPLTNSDALFDVIKKHQLNFVAYTYFPSCADGSCVSSRIRGNGNKMNYYVFTHLSEPPYMCSNCAIYFLTCYSKDKICDDLLLSFFLFRYLNDKNRHYGVGSYSKNFGNRYRRIKVKNRNAGVLESVTTHCSNRCCGVSLKVH